MELKRDYYINHINEFSQYSKSISWAVWYSQVAPLKGKRIINTLLRYKNKNSRVLDLGSGIGLSLVFVAQKFKNTIGCEIGKKEFSATRKILKDHKLKTKVVLYDAKKLPFKDGYFDVVMFNDVIEHTSNPMGVLREINRVLKKDGILHITTANKLWPLEPHFKLPFLSYLPESIADMYVRLAGKGESYDKIKLPTYDQFRKMVGKYFEIEDLTVDIILNYKKYKLDKERGNKIAFLASFLNSLKKSKNYFINGFYKLLVSLLLRISLGWIFIARPKNV